MAIAGHSSAIDVGGAGHALLDHADGLEAQEHAEPAGGESGDVLDDDRLLAELHGERAGEGDRFFRRRSRAHDLDQLHDVDGVEEVHADETGAIGHPASDVADGERAGVAGQERGRQGGRVDLGEGQTLELDVLGDRLDDDLGAGDRLGQVDAGRDPRQGCVAGGGVELAARHATVEVVAHAIDPGAQGLLGDVLQDHVVAGERGDLADPASHDARADDGDLANLVLADQHGVKSLPF